VASPEAPNPDTSSALREALEMLVHMLRAAADTPSMSDGFRFQAGLALNDAQRALLALPDLEQVISAMQSLEATVQTMLFSEAITSAQGAEVVKAISDRVTAVGDLLLAGLTQRNIVSQQMMSSQQSSFTSHSAARTASQAYIDYISSSPDAPAAESSAAGPAEQAPEAPAAPAPASELTETGSPEPTSEAESAPEASSDEMDADYSYEEYDNDGLSYEVSPMDYGGGEQAQASESADDGAQPEASAARVVNTGFSQRDNAAQALTPQSTLSPATGYWFWLEVGELIANSIEVTPTALPETLPADALLTVMLFAYPDELQLTPGADTAEIRLRGGAQSEVVRQPGEALGQVVTGELAQRRLFFPVKTTAREGPQWMRCNIYHQHILLQSRRITAQVGSGVAGSAGLTSVLDFKLSHTLDPARLSRMTPQTLNVFTNSNAEGTHGFYFEGKGELKTQATIPEGTLQDSLTQVRKTLRNVAWGSTEVWQKGWPYRYDAPGEAKFFQDDLKDLARRGYMLYSTLIDGITGSANTSDDLATLMLVPGVVQISSVEAANLVVPAALFYDRPLDSQVDLTVCEAFLKSVRAGQPLASSDCFNGKCPTYGDPSIVCPGGFWGYRHDIGLPVSTLQNSAGDAPADIEFTSPASMLVVVSLDPMFKQRETHETHLKAVRAPMDFTLCDSRSKVIDAFQKTPAEIVYFYCHGSTTQFNTPFLSIGNDESITPDNLRAWKVRWKSPRPLVFMNGCMTAALEPEKAAEFVSAFVNIASASGVIGTEITVFEPLATTFAESFLGYFLGDCRSVGASVRLARLRLLEQFNPLGLVYIPFALPGLHLVDTTAPAAAA
jgi:hypothetical protein